MIRLLSLGSGSTWPGEIALRFNKNFIKDFFSTSDTKVILIAGTNGKTTTSTLIKFILEADGKTVFQNEEGANLLNGVASAIIKSVNFPKKITYDFATFEIDENTLPQTLKQLKPHTLILLNLFRDQLDRYGEVNTIANNWRKSIQTLDKNTSLILNGDDPQIAYLGENCKANVYYFGVSQDLAQVKDIPHDVDSIYCPKCNSMLTYSGISYSHLGKYQCLKCKFMNPTIINYNLELPLKGIYNKYNTNAVFTFLDQILHIPLEKIAIALKQFKPAFGRQEEIIYKGRKIYLLLSKNPTGFNQSIAVMNEIFGKDKRHLLLVLNDRIPDGKDISWIWDVEFEQLEGQIVVSGDRCLDMGIRLKYGEIEKFKILEDLEDAVEEIVASTKKEEKIVILATYTGMLEVRKILVGKSLI